MGPKSACDPDYPDPFNRLIASSVKEAEQDKQDRFAPGYARYQICSSWASCRLRSCLSCPIFYLAIAHDIFNHLVDETLIQRMSLTLILNI